MLSCSNVGVHIGNLLERRSLRASSLKSTIKTVLPTTESCLGSSLHTVQLISSEQAPGSPVILTAVSAFSVSFMHLIS